MPEDDADQKRFLLPGARQRCRDAGRGVGELQIRPVGAERRSPAARIGSPADSVRFRVEGLAYSPGASGRLYGYPSEVSFPSAGQWVIVATAGNDWGCFVLDVAPHTAGN